MERICRATRGKTEMNFTILSEQFNENLSLNVTPEHKIIIHNGIEYLVCPDGKQFAIWALLDLVKSPS